MNSISTIKTLQNVETLLGIQYINSPDSLETKYTIINPKQPLCLKEATVKRIGEIIQNELALNRSEKMKSLISVIDEIHHNQHSIVENQSRVLFDPTSFEKYIAPHKKTLEANIKAPNTPPSYPNKNDYTITTQPDVSISQDRKNQVTRNTNEIVSQALVKATRTDKGLTKDNFSPKLHQLFTAITLFMFPGESHFTSPNQQLGRFDVVAIPTKMNYDAKWNPKEAKEFFYTIQAAAPNIGDGGFQKKPADLKDYQTHYRGSVHLNINRLKQDIQKLNMSIFTAAEQLDCTEVVYLPIGMGAFMNQLGQHIPEYKNNNTLQSLKYEYAEAFCEALSQCSSTKTVHLCLIPGPNAKAFEEALGQHEDLKTRVKIHYNEDAPVFAQNLADQGIKAAFVNGANRTVFGNQYFKEDHARQAVDENTTRRSKFLAICDALLNGSVEEGHHDRKYGERLHVRLQKAGGRVNFMEFPKKQGSDVLLQPRVKTLSVDKEPP